MRLSDAATGRYDSMTGGIRRGLEGGRRVGATARGSHWRPAPPLRGGRCTPGHSAPAVAKRRALGPVQVSHFCRVRTVADGVNRLPTWHTRELIVPVLLAIAV